MRGGVVEEEVVEVVVLSLLEGAGTAKVLAGPVL